MTFLAALLLLAQADEVQQLMSEFRSRQEQARTADELRGAARATLAKLDAVAGTNARAAFHAAELCLVLDEAAAALARLREAVERGLSGEQLGTARYLLGELSLQEQDFGGGRKWLAEFVKEHAGDSRTLGARVLVELSYAIEGKPDDALAGLKKIRDEVRGQPQEWQIAATIAAALHFAERNAESKAAFEEVARGCRDLQLAESVRQTLAAQARLGSQPSLAATDAAGRRIDLADLRGQVVLIYFYSISVPSAPMEASTMRRILKATEGKGVTAVGVCLDPAREDFDLLRRDLAITWPLVHDGGGTDGAIAKRFDVRGTPHVLVLDKKGVVRFVNPMLTSSGMDLRALVERLHAER